MNEVKSTQMSNVSHADPEAGSRESALVNRGLG
jgi:hypothetical protein